MSNRLPLVELEMALAKRLLYTPLADSITCRELRQLGTSLALVVIDLQDAKLEAADEYPTP